MKVLSTLVVAALALSAAPSMAQPSCPPGLSPTTFPACEVGVAVYLGSGLGVDNQSQCFWVGINSRIYAVQSSVPGGTLDANSDFLMQGLNMGKGDVHVFIADGQPSQKCALPNVVVKHLGEIVPDVSVSVVQ